MTDNTEELDNSIELIEWEVSGPDGTPVKVTLV